MLPLIDMAGIGQGREFTFVGDAVSAATSWKALAIPPQYTMAHFFVLGGGGASGNGAVGANSTAAGGGGGGSAGQTSLFIPTRFLPDTIYISAGYGGNAANGSGLVSRVAIQPDVAVNHQIAIANGGGGGGNAAGATAGAAGAAGAAATLALMPLSARGVSTLLIGQTGIIGGVAVAGAAQTLPTTGLLVTGGTGGGGLPAAATAGTNGGAFTVPAGGFFPANVGGAGSAVAANPPLEGSHGVRGFNGLDYYYGGTGGGSTHGTATGGGLVGARGGDGAYGCGGGGGGGALTGSTQGSFGRGGAGLVVVTLL